jgi:hypothetical protein
MAKPYYKIFWNIPRNDALVGRRYTQPIRMIFNTT